jgi:hypothetical protein
MGRAGRMFGGLCAVVIGLSLLSCAREPRRFRAPPREAERAGKPPPDRCGSVCRSGARWDVVWSAKALDHGGYGPRSDRLPDARSLALRP